MTAHRVTPRTMLGLVLVAGAIAPAAASAHFDQNPVYFPTPAGDPGHAFTLERASIRIADQIRLVRFGVVPRTELGPVARAIYANGGASTAEPDAAAVKASLSGNLLSARGV